MKSIVLELQREALDRNVAVSDLLRKALVVARKLGIAEFETWTSKELNGYQKDDSLPDYRKIHGTVEAWNPYHGWQPVLFENPKEAENVSTVHDNRSIAEFESILKGSKPGTTLGMRYPPRIEHELVKNLQPMPTNVILRLSEAGFAHMLDAVRNIVLNWTLQLERDGITGQDLTFSTEEKQAASRGSYQVMNFYGPVTTGQIQQASDYATQTSMPIDFDALRKFLDELKNIPATELPLAEKPAFDADLATIDAQLKGPKPKTSVIKECLRSVRSILENAGGAVTADLFVRYGPMLAQWLSS